MKLAEFCLQMVLDPQFPDNTPEIENDHFGKRAIKYLIQTQHFSKIKLLINTTSVFPVSLEVFVTPGD